MAAVASFARRTAAFRFSLRPSVSRSSPSQSRTQLPQLPLPSRSSPSQSASSFRRESAALFTMLPVHSAIASSRLVSRIPSEPSACAESKVVSLGQFDPSQLGACIQVMGLTESGRAKSGEIFLKRACDYRLQVNKTPEEVDL